MSGTAGGYSAPSVGGVILPAPKVQLYTPSPSPDLVISDGSPVAGALRNVRTVRRAKVTVPGLSQAILDDLDTYKPQVELMRFTRLNTRENASGGNGTKSSGYVHPAHGPAASGNGSFTHGGHHGGVDPAIWPIRPTEWAITAGNDSVDVTLES